MDNVFFYISAFTILNVRTDTHVPFLTPLGIAKHITKDLLSENKNNMANRY